MVRGTRLFALLRPYTSLFAATVAATVVSSVLDGFTFVLLIPFLRSLFGEAALPAQGGSHVEAMLDRIAGPFLHAGAAETALRNVVILFGLSTRLTLLALAFAPVLLFIVRPMISRLRRRSRELVAERGELTSHVGEMVGSVKLIRAYVAEAFELERFKRLAERYLKRVLRAQRFSSLTSPVTEVFGGVMIVMILWVGTRLALGDPTALRPEMLITFLAVALRLMSPV